MEREPPLKKCTNKYMNRTIDTPTRKTITKEEEERLSAILNSFGEKKSAARRQRATSKPSSEMVCLVL
jgi:hypothetical protein